MIKFKSLLFVCLFLLSLLIGYFTCLLRLYWHDHNRDSNTLTFSFSHKEVVDLYFATEHFNLSEVFENRNFANHFPENIPLFPIRLDTYSNQPVERFRLFNLHKLQGENGQAGSGVSEYVLRNKNYKQPHQPRPQHPKTNPGKRQDGRIPLADFRRVLQCLPPAADSDNILVSSLSLARFMKVTRRTVEVTASWIDSFCDWNSNQCKNNIDKLKDHSLTRLK